LNLFTPLVLLLERARMVIKRSPLFPKALAEHIG
jgi:hypothetical protein